MNKNKKKVAIFIDGSNFYFKMRSTEFNFSDLTGFNYRKFAEWLARDREIVWSRYYVGVVRAKPGDEKGQKLRQNQQKLFSHLESSSQKFKVVRGYIMNNDGIFHEKGVDVKLAVDLIVGAYEDMYNEAIVVSSDTDLIPAIKKAKELGKRIEYIGFSNQPSIAMQKNATLSRLLIKEDLEPFVVQTLL